jgi:hypothetical protein
VKPLLIAAAILLSSCARIEAPDGSRVTVVAFGDITIEHEGTKIEVRKAGVYGTIVAIAPFLAIP